VINDTFFYCLGCGENNEMKNLLPFATRWNEAVVIYLKALCWESLKKITHVSINVVGGVAEIPVRMVQILGP
jgi:hypothetical protein